MSDPRPTLTDDAIRAEWERARSFYRAQFGYRSTSQPGPGLAERLLARSIAYLEAHGVTDADVDRLGLPPANEKRANG